jgi:spore coat-associated protein N
MSRFKILAANPRRSLAALATVLVAVGVTGASGASFTAQTANPSNVFSAGTMTMVNSKDNAAILTASNMKPGDPATVGFVDITNSGSLAGTFTLSKGTMTDTDGVTPMSGKLNLIVTDCGTDLNCGAGINPVVYTGTVAGMGTNLALGSFAALEARRFQFSVAFDSTAGNSYQGDSSTVQFLWDAS